MSDGKVIMPTQTCFDDALDYVTHRVKEDPRVVERLLVVHGICLVPEGRRKDEQFSHAWVEELQPSPLPVLVWQGGLLDGERIFYACEHADFAKELRPQHVTRYSVRQAAHENARSGHFGPWRPEYSALCRKEGDKPDIFWPEGES